jgi:hypothetical protein
MQMLRHENYDLNTCYTITYAGICIDGIRFIPSCIWHDLSLFFSESRTKKAEVISSALKYD